LGGGEPALVFTQYRTMGELRPVMLSLHHNGVVEMVGRRRSARYRVTSGA